ncbi:hypothetical protein TPAR_07397, partial [Tolypocladium paradoxum]
MPPGRNQARCRVVYKTLRHRAAAPVRADQTSHLQQGPVRIDIRRPEVNLAPGLGLALLPRPPLRLRLGLVVAAAAPDLEPLDLEAVLEVVLPRQARVERAPAGPVVVVEDAKLERVVEEQGHGPQGEHFVSA